MFAIPAWMWNPTCYPGAPTLPPVRCRTYSGRPVIVAEARWANYGHASGCLDAPGWLPAGSHQRPGMYCATIYAAEISREAA